MEPILLQVLIRSPLQQCDLAAAGFHPSHILYIHKVGESENREEGAFRGLLTESNRVYSITYECLKNKLHLALIVLLCLQGIQVWGTVRNRTGVK